MADVKSITDAGLKPAPPQAGGSRRRPWLIAAGLGLLLGVLIGGLGIALPISLRKKQQLQQADAVNLSAGDAGVRQLKGTTRSYYLAADKIDWDYAPSGKDLCHNREFTGPAELYTLQGIGTKYKKAVYRQYNDSSFKDLKPRAAAEEHMGLLGPPLHAEVGDTVMLVIRNNLDFPINVMAGGVNSEGAPIVNPGDTYTAKWYVPASAGPPEDGPSSQLWVYRSTVDVVRDTQAGLAGPLVVTRPGGLNADGKPADVDKEIYVMLQVFNEANSPFYEENAEPHAKALAELSEVDAAESVMKYTVNGFIYCNVPGMNMTVGDRVRWYVSSLGSEDAIHTAHWHGIALRNKGHNVDQIVVQASSTYALDAHTDNPGTWLFHCHLTDHIHGGMMALFNIDGTAPEQKLNGKTREYFIAAVPEVWDYVPFGGEMCGGGLKPVNFSDNAKTFVEPGPDRIGGKYLKAMYVEFTDATFKTRKRRAPEEEHLGLLGPIVRGTVGDTLLVTFKNMVPGHNVSVHSHGVWYDKDSEGSPYYDGLPVAAADRVAPNKVVTYKWLVPERAGPGPADAGSIMWMYHSHVDEAADPAAGLMGAIIITPADNANEDATPKDVTREFVLSFAIMDETTSFMAEENYAKYLPAALRKNATALEELIADPGFAESNLMHSINGYMYCNMPGLDFIQGQSVRVHFMAFGSSADMHTPNTAESQLFLDGHRKQAVALLPGAMLTADITPLVPGKGLLQCHVYDHISAGMSAIYNVKNLGQLVAPASAPVRTYYIAAEPVTWDYAPLGYDGCTGQPWNEQQMIFTQTTNETLGSQYKKGMFREYTDGTFKTLKEQPPHHGFLGPMMRAEVGDKLVVHFLNRLLFNASVQVFGGLAPIGNTTEYQVNIAADAPAPAAPAAPAPAAVAKAGRRMLNSGAGSSRRLSQISAAEAEAEAIIAQSVENIYSLGSVAPGGSKRYEWFVPDTAGPGSSDGPSVVYAYVSGVDHIKHINAGLVGPLVIYKKGRLNDPGADLEVPLLFNIQNEMQSVYYADNMAIQQNKTGLTIDTAALTFPESNLMHTLNGYIYCNGPTLQLNAGDRVRWMVMGFGSEADMHSPVFDGQAVEFGGKPVYSVGLMPSNTYIVEMTANSSGTWEYYCNILDHIWAGMKARMLVS